MSYCPHYHIDCGQGQCWAIVDNIGKYGMSIADLKRYARPTACGGNEDICEFKKFGVKEKINDNRKTARDTRSAQVVAERR